LVAGAIADNKRGQLVGQKTFGSGSFQRLIPLEDGSALLISVGKYYTPNGTEIQEAGIKPTVEVGQPDEDVFDPNSEDQLEVQAPPDKSKPEQQEDRQLKKAIEILKAPPVKAAPAE
jgi:carboxyl-terminal processing protease